jgi:hypothetical protein
MNEPEGIFYEVRLFQKYNLGGFKKGIIFESLTHSGAVE